MPKIFYYFGYEIYIYTDDHLPVHVHVKYQGGEGRFELIYENGKLKVGFSNIKGKKRLSQRQTNEMERFVTKYHLQIKNQWDVVHYYNKKPVCITIREKV